MFAALDNAFRVEPKEAQRATPLRVLEAAAARLDTMLAPAAEVKFAHVHLRQDGEDLVDYEMLVKPRGGVCLRVLAVRQRRQVDYPCAVLSFAQEDEEAVAHHVDLEAAVERMMTTPGFVGRVRTLIGG